MEILREIPLFESLSEADIQRLSKISHTKNYKKNEILFYEGDTSKWLFVVLSGSVKIYETNPKGSQIFLHVIHQISLIAELVNFEDIKYPATAEFMEDSKILMIDYAKFKEDFLKNPEISFGIIKSFTKKLKILSEVLHQETILTAQGKVAKFIVENSEIFGHLKYNKIASIINLTPETFSRILSKFKKQKLIKQNDDLSLEEFDIESLQKLYISL